MTIRRNELLEINDSTFEYSSIKYPTELIFHCFGIQCCDCEKSTRRNFCVFAELFENEANLKTKR